MEKKTAGMDESTDDEESVSENEQTAVASGLQGRQGPKIIHTKKKLCGNILTDAVRKYEPSWEPNYRS